MSTLFDCAQCKGFLTPKLRTCPHCNEPVSPALLALRSLATIATGGITSFTLMACYGDAGSPYDPPQKSLPDADAAAQVDGSHDATIDADKGDATDAAPDVADASDGAHVDANADAPNVDASDADVDAATDAPTGG